MEEDKAISSTKKVCIDTHMIPAKLTFFFSDGFFGSIQPFFNIFYTSLGLTASQTGLISGISLATSSVSSTFWSGLADSTGRRQFLFLLLCLGTSSTLFPLPFVASAVGHYTTNHNCSESKIKDDVEDCTYKKELTNSNQLFLTMLIMSIIGRFFFHGLSSFVEGLVMNVVKTKGATYGPQKVFSAFGYAFFNFIAGVIIWFWKSREFSDYTGAFFVFLFCVFALVPSGTKLISQGNWISDTSKNQSSYEFGILRELCKVCAHGYTIVILITVAVSAAAINLLQGFGFMMFKDYYNATSLEMVLVVAICMVSELIFYPLSSRIIRRVGGPYPCIILGLSSYFPRYMIMAYCRIKWVLVLMQLFQGVGLALTWTSIMDISYIIFPEKIKMTGISLMSALHGTIVASVLNIVGGIVYHIYGGLVLFKAIGILCGVWSLFLVFYRRTYQKHIALLQKETPTISECGQDNVYQKEDV